MDLHMKQFDGTTFGMSVQASDLAFKRMKKDAFTGKVVPVGGITKRLPAVSGLWMWPPSWALPDGWSAR